MHGHITTLAKAAYDLCHLIEGFPASEYQTKVVCAASALMANISPTNNIFEGIDVDFERFKKAAELEKRDLMETIRMSENANQHERGVLLANEKLLRVQLYDANKELGRLKNMKSLKQSSGALQTQQEEPPAKPAYDYGSFLDSQKANAVRVYTSEVKKELRRVSKGEMNTWGFVALFIDILDRVASPDKPKGESESFGGDRPPSSSGPCTNA
jgi:hypothetical protein